MTISVCDGEHDIILESPSSSGLGLVKAFACVIMEEQPINRPLAQLEHSKENSKLGRGGCLQ